MSEWFVEVTKINGSRPHPNADSLRITNIHGDGTTGEGGYPVIFKQDAFKDGDPVVYIPVDSILPDTPEYEFIYSDLGRGENGKVKDKYLDLDGKVKEKYRRIKAKKLRGIFSMGMLNPLPEGDWKEGDVVHEAMGITKYEPPMEFKVGDNAKDEGILPTYTNIKGFRKYPRVFQDGEEVVLTEKIHGTNARFIFKDGKLTIGSHHMIKQYPSDCIWGKIAELYKLEERLDQFDGVAIYGEIYGRGVQKMQYDNSQPKLRLFDALDTHKGEYLNWDDFVALCNAIEMEHAPVLYRGPWSDSLLDMRNGKSTLASHVREGFVVKPTQEEYSEKMVGRKILKFVGEDYQLNKKS